MSEDESEEISGGVLKSFEGRNSIELKKTTKGYTWNIKIYNDNLEELKKQIADTDLWCSNNYGTA